MLEGHSKCWSVLARTKAFLPLADRRLHEVEYDQPGHINGGAPNATVSHPDTGSRRFGAEIVDDRIHSLLPVEELLDEQFTPRPNDVRLVIPGTRDIWPRVVLVHVFPDLMTVFGDDAAIR